jgi:Phage tail lysozyme
VSSAPPYARKRKIRRRGRHAALSQVQKAARRAGKAAPVVAVIGVLSAMPQTYHLLPPATPAAAASHQPAGHRAIPGLAMSASAGLPVSAAHAARHGAPTRASHPGSRASITAHRRHRARQHASAARHPAPACTGTAGMLPANYAAIVGYLTAHGYTAVAAAGIAGNIYQESGGNPESVGSGGGGLIGWTPLPAGFVTGNPSADLQTQLAAVLTFNQQWSQYIPALNAAASATAAADIYMNDFERPGIPAAYNREAAASAVAAACGL